jgi:hypothetical protein
MLNKWEALTMIGFFVAVGIASCNAKAEGLAVNVYGLSYHPDRELAHDLKLDNEFNPGLGLRHTWANGVFAEIGAYRDSGKETARVAGIGYQWAFGVLKVGGALAYFNSNTYNNGKEFIAPVPIISVDLNKAILNVTHFPKVEGLNSVAAWGFYVSFPVKQF